MITDYIRKVGRGKTLAKDLTGPEAVDAFAQLLKGHFTPAQAGAFLQALRIKELSAEELDGLMLVFSGGKSLSASPAGLALNLASDTPRKGGYASLLAAAGLAHNGLSVGVIRSEPMLSRNSESWESTWRMFGAAFPANLEIVHVYNLLPELQKLEPMRNELGFRSCLHTAEKLVNPWSNRPVVLGISHRHYAERMAENLRKRKLRGKIVLGNHGTPDLVLHKETEILEVLADGSLRTLHIRPADFGLAPDPGVYAVGFLPEWPKEWAKPGRGAFGPVLRYHLAFLRYAAETVPDLASGMEGLDEMLDGHLHSKSESQLP